MKGLNSEEKAEHSGQASQLSFWELSVGYIGSSRKKNISFVGHSKLVVKTENMISKYILK